MDQLSDEGEPALLRDYKHGKASGCSEMKSRKAKKVIKETLVGSSSGAVVENEGEDKWRALTSGSASAAMEGEEGSEKLVITTEGYDKHGGDDDWDDLVPVLPCHKEDLLPPQGEGGGGAGGPKKGVTLSW